MGPNDRYRPLSRLDQDERDDRQLEELRREFPADQWEVQRTFGGWLCTPAGAPVIKALTVAGIAEKLRELAGVLVTDDGETAFGADGVAYVDGQPGE